MQQGSKLTRLMGVGYLTTPISHIQKGMLKIMPTANAPSSEHEWHQEAADANSTYISCSCGYKPKDNPVLDQFVNGLRERHVMMVLAGN